jgi:hypothetical protein
MPAPSPPPNFINKTSSIENSQMTFHGFSSFIHGIWIFNEKNKIVNELMMDEINHRWYFLVELYFILRYPEFLSMPFALNMFKIKIKTVFYFWKGSSQSWKGYQVERERKKEKGFWGADQKQIQEMGRWENLIYLGSLSQPIALSGPDHLAM